MRWIFAQAIKTPKTNRKSLSQLRPHNDSTRTLAGWKKEKWNRTFPDSFLGISLIVILINGQLIWETSTAPTDICTSENVALHKRPYIVCERDFINRRKREILAAINNKKISFVWVNSFMRKTRVFSHRKRKCFRNEATRKLLLSFCCFFFPPNCLFFFCCCHFWIPYSYFFLSGNASKNANILKWCEKRKGAHKDVEYSIAAIV